MTRRQGITRAALAALTYSKSLGANDRIRGAIIGCGTRGLGAHLVQAEAQPDIEIVAACDVYKPNLDRGLTMMATAGYKTQGYDDYRRILERKDIDVVFVATPDHWHAPMTVDACAAGKDVYVEKPLANSIEDCLAIVDAEKKYNRIVQMGVQQRSMQIYFQALQIIRDGKIGPVKRCSMVWSSDSKGRRKPDDLESKPPDGFDWDKFQGPAPHRPYRPSRQHNWHYYWEYGSGNATDLGVHMFDVTRWFMDLDLPRVTFGAGYRSPTELPEQVPDIIDLSFQYDRFIATFSGEHGEMANTFWGEAGYLSVNRSMLRYALFPVPGNPPPKPVEIKSTEIGPAAGPHMRNFLDSVRSRRKPNADAETGCKSTIPCLLAARSLRTGKAYHFDWQSRLVKVI
jgi:predicted dehydrogenase